MPQIQEMGPSSVEWHHLVLNTNSVLVGSLGKSNNVVKLSLYNLRTIKIA